MLQLHVLSSANFVLSTSVLLRPYHSLAIGKALHDNSMLHELDLLSTELNKRTVGIGL